MSWRIIGDTFTIFGTGATPRIEPESGLAPTPPNPTPAPQPPQPHPGEDTSPYVWPTGGPNRAAYDYERTSWVWLIPGYADDDPRRRMYAMIPTTGNPSFSSHQDAGIIQQGPQAGQRLWAPPSAPPAMLRAVIAGRL